MSVKARRKERDQTHRVVACQYETYRFDPQTGTKRRCTDSFFWSCAFVFVSLGLNMFEVAVHLGVAFMGGSLLLNVGREKIYHFVEVQRFMISTFPPNFSYVPYIDITYN